MKRAAIGFAAFAVFACTVFSQNAGDFEYKKEGGGITITGYTGSAKKIVIPERIDGLPVVAIGSDVFWDGQLTGVSIGNSVVSIGSGAFWNNRLTSVEIPHSVKTIGDAAFAANQLTSVNIGDSVVSIGNGAFWNNQLTGIVIPDSVETIGNVAFASNRLTGVSIGNSVVSIGGDAFYDNQLTSVVVPHSVENLADDAFDIDVKMKNPAAERRGSSVEKKKSCGLFSLYTGGLPPRHYWCKNGPAVRNRRRAAGY
jgi:hypothetical protein